MLNRYSTEEMNHIWDETTKFNCWLKVELLASEAFTKFGVVPQEDLAKLYENATFNIDDIYQIEAQTKHDVIAFTRAVGLHLGEEKKWLHYGLTSTDVVDTAYAYQIKIANEVISDALEQLSNTIKKLAYRYQYTPCMGRTHGIHAEVTTFGLKMALWYDQLQRDIERFNFARKNIEIGKISGAVGTFGNTPPSVQDYVCLHLGIRSANISTQVLQRDRHAQYFSTLALIGSSIERFATEIRHLQRTEVNEVREGFSSGQKGSSAMPHKRNPIGSENMAGCSRVLRGYMLTAYENVNLWHERDISHSSAERIIFPDATTLLHYMLKRFNGILENLEVDEKQMLVNIDLTYGAVFSGQVLNTLCSIGLSREEAYDLIQPIALRSYRDKIDYEKLLLENDHINRLLSIKEIKDCFELTHHLKEVDAIYKRVFNDN